MKGVITALFCLALATGCGDRSRPEPTGEAATKPAQETPVAVAGSGTSQEIGDPAQSLYKRTYAILPHGQVTLTGSTAGVSVWNMGDGTRIERTGGAVLAGSVSALAMIDEQTGLLAAATGPTGVALLDASKASDGDIEVLQQGHWASMGGCHAAWKVRHLSQGRIIIACGTSGVSEADVSDPSKPFITRSVPTGGYVRDLAILDPGSPSRPARVVAATGQAGLAIIEFPISGDPVVLSRLDTKGDARALALQGSRAYVADGPAGLLIADLSDPRKPVPEAVLDLEQRDMARGILVQAGIAYMCMGNSGLIVVDVKAPGSPVRIGGFDPGRAFNHAAIVDEKLYGANDDAGILVLDISEPNEPAQLFPPKE